MCTISFVPHADGFRLGMNRDEQRTRPRGLSPEFSVAGDSRVLSPREPSGGTWVAVNEHAIAFALLNWYAQPAVPVPNPRSRGEIIPALAASRTADEATSVFHRLDLAATQPFRLVVCAGGERRARELRWDGRQPAVRDHPWTRGHWFSSAVAESQAQRARRAHCDAAAAADDPRGADWIRTLHRAHEPARGPLSICMHREDAATVSYTEIAVEADAATMFHHAGRPCEPAFEVELRMPMGGEGCARGGT